MAQDFFLEIKGIPGESKDSKYKGLIDVLSWSWGESNSGTYGEGGGGGAGVSSQSDFSFAMTINKASPLLFLNCANGAQIESATLHCRLAGETQQEFLTIKMSPVRITSFQTGGSDGAGKPVESVSLNFGKIEYGYAEQKDDNTMEGIVTKWWDKLTKKGG